MIVKLLGDLGRRFGKSFDLNVNSAVEAIRLLGCQIDGFNQYLSDASAVGGGYDGFRVCNPCKPEGYDVDQLDHHIRGDVIIIAPMISGSGGFGKILLGVALVGAAFLIPGAAVGAMTNLGLVGASLILSGISQLIAPKPRNKDTQDDNSNLIDRAGGSATQGMPVPVLLGRKYILLDQSKVLSAKLTSNERLVIPPPELRSYSTNTYIVSSPPGNPVIGAW